MSQLHLLSPLNISASLLQGVWGCLRVCMFLCMVVARESTEISLNSDAKFRATASDGSDIPKHTHMPVLMATYEL